jgi:hypothetical protein
MTTTNTKWFTRGQYRFRDLSIRTDRMIAAGVEIEPVSDYIWEVSGTMIRAELNDNQILTVWTNANGSQQISWKDGSTTQQFGIVALYLELQEAKQNVKT